MRKTLYFDSFCGYLFSAVTENEKLIEFSVEKSGDGGLVGNVYKGRVESVLPGMHAAFVNCGLERNCYLSADDFFPDREKYDLNDPAEPDMPDLHVGDDVLVQVVKPPVGTKGAKVTTHLTFVGKSIIYMPDTPFIGVSQKIADKELRKNLVFAASKLISAGEGLVVRTAAPYAKRNQIEEEYIYLKELYREITAAFPSAAVGRLLYTDFALPVKILRDTLSADIDSIVVGSPKLAEMISNIVAVYPPRSRRPVVLHDTGRDMMDELGISAQIAEITQSRVPLDNGAHIVIERTEALTVIDVNTGKFTGDDSLEQTVYYTNILAAREIARQVRLRNIGGIVVVDFIDMQQTKHKKALVEELERALKDDKAKCVVSPMSRLGLVEFSRKRMGSSPLSLMLKPCKYCGAGRTKRPEYIIIELRAKLLNEFADGAKAVRVDMNREVFDRLFCWEEMRADILAHANGAEVILVPHRTYHEEQINLKREPFDIPDDGVKL